MLLWTIARQGNTCSRVGNVALRAVSLLMRRHSESNQSRRRGSDAYFLQCGCGFPRHIVAFVGSPSNTWGWLKVVSGAVIMPLHLFLHAHFSPSPFPHLGLLIFCPTIVNTFLKWDKISNLRCVVFPHILLTLIHSALPILQVQLFTLFINVFCQLPSDHTLTCL